MFRPLAEHSFRPQQAQHILTVYEVPTQILGQPSGATPTRHRGFWTRPLMKQAMPNPITQSAVAVHVLPAGVAARLDRAIFSHRTTGPMRTVRQNQRVPRRRTELASGKVQPPPQNQLFHHYRQYYGMVFGPTGLWARRNPGRNRPHPGTPHRKVGPRRSSQGRSEIRGPTICLHVGQNHGERSCFGRNCNHMGCKSLRHDTRALRLPTTGRRTSVCTLTYTDTLS